MHGVAANNAEGLGAPARPVSFGHVLHSASRQPRFKAPWPARHQLQRSAITDQLTPFVRVSAREQVTDRHAREIGVSIPCLAVREGELGALRNEVDVVRRQERRRAKSRPLEEQQLLQKHRPLTPRPALGDGPIAKGRGDGLLTPG